MKKTLLTLTIFLSALYTQAQVVLTGTDMPVVGDIFMTLIDDRDSVFDPGTAGTGKIWDYTMMQISDTDGTFFQDLSVLPAGWANNFPDANFTHYSSADSSAQMFSSSNEGLIMEGFYDNKIDANITEVNFEPGILYIPANGFTYESHFHHDSRFEFEQFQGVWVKFAITIEVHIEGDATGTLLTDFGNHANVLRAMRLQYQTDSIFVDFGMGGGYELYQTDGPKDSSLSYMFYKDGPGCLLGTLDVDPITNKSISFGYNYFYHSPVAAKELIVNSEVFLSPNPNNSGFLKISNVPVGSNQLEIIDLTGKPVKSFQINKNEQRIDVKELSQGVYLYSLKNTDTNQVSSGKIVITE